MQGTRDNLAAPDLVRTVCERLGDRAKLHFVESADHSFRVPKRPDGNHERVLEALADRICGWAAATAGEERK